MFWDGERWLPTSRRSQRPSGDPGSRARSPPWWSRCCSRCAAPARQRRRRSDVRARPYGALERTGHDGDRAGDQLTDHLSRQLVHGPARKLPRRQGEIHGQGRREGGAPVQRVRNFLDWLCRSDSRQGQGLLDGKRVATVNTWARSFRPTRVIFQHSWEVAGSHRIAIVAKGTAGHPTVALDAFFVQVDGATDAAGARGRGKPSPKPTPVPDPSRRRPTRSAPAPTAEADASCVRPGPHAWAPSRRRAHRRRRRQPSRRHLLRTNAPPRRRRQPSRRHLLRRPHLTRPAPPGRRPPCQRLTRPGDLDPGPAGQARRQQRDRDRGGERDVPGARAARASRQTRSGSEPAVRRPYPPGPRPRRDDRRGDLRRRRLDLLDRPRLRGRRPRPDVAGLHLRQRQADLDRRHRVRPAARDAGPAPHHPARHHHRRSRHLRQRRRRRCSTMASTSRWRSAASTTSSSTG